ncbi:MAG TPA: NfeD family protein [Gaiellales bacterium]|nr:NfeD family protein [Gaiellales bacterium]
MAAIPTGTRDPARVQRVRAAGADGRIAKCDLGEHEPAKRRRHPAEEHTAAISLIIAILLAFFVLPSPWGLVAVLCACVLEIFEVTWGLRLARKRSTIGAHTLIGRQAVVVRALDPVGQVTIDGERWKARSAAGAAVGAKVVIERIDGLTLEVRVYTSVSDADAGGAARRV